MHEVRSALGLVTVQQRLANVPGQEGHSVAVTTLTDIRTEDNKAGYCGDWHWYAMIVVMTSQEVALRLCSSVANGDGVFYTDLNGLQLVRRKTVSKLPLQGNFYPMPTAALLQNSTHRLSLLAAQPHGVASLKPGECPPH